jgi:hypothetical protein
MLKKIILAGLITTLATAPAFAEGPSKEEGIGVGVGAVVGAIAGGPVGFIIGAAAGAKLGDEFFERNTEIDELTASLHGSQDKVSKLERDIVALGGDIERLQRKSRPELLALLQAGIEMDLLFRTDEHTLADTTGSRLTITVNAHGESPAADDNIDSLAFERKVSLTLYVDSAQSFAANPN